MRKFLKALGLGLFGLALSATSSFAAIDVTGVDFDVSPVEALGGLMLAALALIWVVRKVLSIVRS
jgi:UDP-N-acetyl-D-mannosaminuronate dehydrogenase